MTTEASPTGRDEKVAVQSLTPCLVFDDRAEEAMNFYVSVFANSRVLSLNRWGPGAPVAEGKVLHATFELNGREVTAFDGGPHFKFTDGFSLVATVQTQEELDEVWRRLSEGGQPGPCGWLTDRFGLAWQVLPSALGEMMGNPQGGNTAKVMEALLKMGKLDIATLEEAYRQP